MKYDLTVFGGGTSGIATAYIASKYGIKTLLVEKSDVLGGAITRGLVIPSMKVNTKGINTEFFDDLKRFADKYNARHTYIDGNEAWFNPELLKIVFDDMLRSVKCNVLFSCDPVKLIHTSEDDNFNVTLVHKLLSIYIDTKYIVDATSNGKIFQLLKCDFQEKSDKNQAASLRFNLSGIDLKAFSDWIKTFDKDTSVTTIEQTEKQIYLSTAYTWDKSGKWALEPIFKKAVDDGVLEYNDTAYFQIFSIPSMPDTISLNAPRIILDDSEDLLDPFVYSRALRQGRERIYRLYNFCKTYLAGFNNAYISHISDMLGVRESFRVKCKYTITSDKIKKSKYQENPAFACDYPIDIHSNSVINDKLEYTNKVYYAPIEALISEKYDNLYAVGRIISSDFEAQSALRTQLTCFSMGEAAAKDILKKI